MYPHPLDFDFRKAKTDQTSPEHDRRVDFSVRRNGISLSASVSVGYFESHVLPVISHLLEEVAGQPSPAKETVKDGQHAATEPAAPPSLRMIIERTAATKAPEIMKAAAVSLALVHGKPTFTRSDLLDEVVRATGYWRKGYAQGARQIVDYLIASGSLVEAADGTLSLDPAEERSAVALLEGVI